MLLKVYAMLLILKAKMSLLAWIKSTMKRIQKGIIKMVCFIAHQAIMARMALGLSKKKKVVPPITNPLLLKSATALAADIREGKIKSEHVVIAYIDRMEEVNPYINAIVDTRFAEAIEEAREVDALIASGTISAERLAREKPFLGVPFTTKILLQVKGLRCTAGSLIFKDVRAHEDAMVVTQMKNAGAICIANTNSPEFGLCYETFNNLHGMTCNPYDTQRTCGGSSGGEAAIIASAGSIIGIGNDLGGSCRFPAFNCCIFGHKPTGGLLSNLGSFPAVPDSLNRIVTAGPMCRYAEDLMAMMRVLAGDRAEELKIGTEVDFRHVKFYYMLGNCGSALDSKLDEEIEESIKKVGHYFEDTYETTLQHVCFKGMNKGLEFLLRTLKPCMEDVSKHLTGGKVTISPTKEMLKLLFRRSKHNIGSVVAFNKDKMNMVFEEMTEPALTEKVKCLDQEFQRIFEDDAVLLLPTFPHPAMYHYDTTLSIFAVSYMAVFNLLEYPVTQCSLGLSEKGLPLGLQVVAAKNKDNLTLSVAREIEKAFGGWVPPNRGREEEERSSLKVQQITENRNL